MDPQSLIMAELERRRQKAVDMQRQLEMLRSEIRGMEDALQLLGGNAAPAERAPWPHHKRGPRRSNENAPRSLRPESAAVIEIVADAHPNEIRLEAIHQGLLGKGMETKDNTLRSRMSVLAQEGLVDRVGYGRFKITERGAERIGRTLSATESPQPQQSSLIGNDAAPSGDDETRQPEF